MKTTDAPVIRGVVKRPKPEFASVEIYSVGMERVAYVLAEKIGLPVPETWLDDVSGHASSVQRRVVPARSWRQLPAAPMMQANIENKDQWPLAVLFDVWMGNLDRRDVNFVFEPVPPGVPPGRARSSKMWLIDHGLCGLWPANKFDADSREADDIPTSAADVSPTLDPRAEAAIRDRMPPEYRMALGNVQGEFRDRLLDQVRAIGDDAIDTAVNEIPASYFTSGQADATGVFLKARRDALDTVVGSYW